MDIEDCLREGFLEKIKPEKDLIEKEFKEAEYDLKGAEDALYDKDLKWSIIKSYYSMFHAARALLFSLGLKERRHFAIAVVLEDMVKKGKLKNRLVSDFHAAMSAREDADYRYTYSEETASYLIDAAKEFFNTLRGMIKQK
jgi:uncharacterized protein (UPF0332 family)